MGARGAPANRVFHRDPKNPKLARTIDADGLPILGQQYTEGTPYYSVFDVEQQRYTVKKVKGNDVLVCTMVRAVLSDRSPDGYRHAVVQWRIHRNPLIGDKFASRHGQKGICSFLWPQENMPFTDTGMVPDLLFNPHGYPSRMTIGMLIESLAGKASAAHGWPIDASPFVFDEQTPALAYMGELLHRAGYGHLGTETMYSGVTGAPFEVEIFVGVIYYQRLRHMVADKYQVRSLSLSHHRQVRAGGPVDALMRQPVKGRKRAGGIRFGEMERDAMVSHGCPYVLHDRLLLSSDKSVVRVCIQCGGCRERIGHCRQPHVDGVHDAVPAQPLHAQGEKVQARHDVRVPR